MRIEVLVGMIASGKTTYARRRADEGALITCHDDLTEMLHARYRYEQGSRDTYRRMEEDIVRRTIEAGRDAVIDRTHLTRESRSRWVDFVRGPRFDDVPRPTIIAIIFPITAASIHAERRFEADPRGRSYGDWLNVALHHEGQAKAEPTIPNEGFHEIRYQIWEPII